jgi:hypothetical protein
MTSQYNTIRTPAQEANGGFKVLRGTRRKRGIGRIKIKKKRIYTKK